MAKQTEKQQAKRVNPAVSWVLFGVAVALAIGMAVAMCVIALR